MHFYLLKRQLDATFAKTELSKIDSELASPATLWAESDIAGTEIESSAARRYPTLTTVSAHWLQDSALSNHEI
jgi:hypothetical protein